MKKLISATLLTVTLLTLGACSGNAGANSANPDASQNPAANVTTYTIGTSGSFAPFCYTDTDGKLTGYDVEVLRAIDERLDDISFEFKTFDFDGLFLALDGGSVDFISHQLGKNADREAKYLYANEPLGYTSMSIATRAADTSISSVKDLEGKKILITATGVPNTWLTNYNSTTAKTPVGLEYYEGDWVQGMQLVVSGSADATAAPAVNIDTAIKDMGLAVRRAPEPLYTVNVFFIFAKDKIELRDRIDTVLKDLRADGTLASISKQFLGDDYTGIK